MGVDYEFLVVPHDQQTFEDMWFGDPDSDHDWIHTSTVANDISSYCWNSRNIKGHIETHALYFSYRPQGLVLGTTVQYGSKINDLLISPVISEMRKYADIYVGNDCDGVLDEGPKESRKLPTVKEQEHISLAYWLSTR